MFKDKHILLGITGSISAYKMPDLVRHLQGRGAKVKVIMTRGAQAFITPLTFEALTRNQVYTDIFEFYPEHPIIHLDLGRWADLMVICPASADVIAKLAAGLADDLLTSTVLGCSCPVVVCPAMNERMFLYPATQRNLKRLQENGIYVMPPTSGPLACGQGQGRLPDIEDIADYLERFFYHQDLKDYYLIVSAGPTREAIDPVRYLSNRSSGKMGYAIAKMAVLRGAKVTLISGPTHLRPPYGAKLVRVTTAEEMKEAILDCFDEADALIMAAAVADFKPQYQSHKIKKQPHLVLELEKTPDILTLVAQRKRHQIVVGFAAETQNLLSEAERKLRQKHLDLIVANDVGQRQSGFEADNNKVTLIYRQGFRENWPLMPKTEVARRLLDRLKELLCRSC